LIITGKTNGEGCHVLAQKVEILQYWLSTDADIV